MTDTRRQFLAKGGATISALGLAGCLGDGTGTAPEGAGDGTDPAEDTDAATATDTPTDAQTDTPTASGSPDTPTDEPAVTPAETRPPTPLAGSTNWHPDPAVIDQEGYAFLSIAPSALREFAEHLGDGALSGFDDEYPLSGVGTFGEMTAVHQFARNAAVIETSFDRTTVANALEDQGFSEATTHRGFTVFTSGSRAGAVGDDVLITAGRFSSSDDADKQPLVERIVDAGTGNADRYTEVDADCDRLVSALGNAHLFQGRTHDVGATFDGAVGEGLATHVGAERTRVRASVVFADGSVEEGAVADWASDSEVFHGRDPITSTEGRIVDATAAVPTGDVSSFPSEFPGPPIESEVNRHAPQVQFEFEYEATGDNRGLLTVTHYGGDSVDSRELFVEGSGFADVAEADQTEAGEWQGSTSGDDGAVVAGDSDDVGVESDYDLRVVWRAEDGEMATTLATHRGPDA